MSTHDLLVKADSYLSLVLHRHLKPDTPAELREEIATVIAELRCATTATEERRDRRTADDKAAYEAKIDDMVKLHPSTNK